jgi:hypothetical protein
LFQNNFQLSFRRILLKLYFMNAEKRWQRIAERLAESGWSWRHVRLTDRVGRVRHVAEAHNDEETHAVVAPSANTSFGALDHSINSADK